jgi:hypothetical protein
MTRVIFKSAVALRKINNTRFFVQIKINEKDVKIEKKPRFTPHPPQVP